MTSVNPVSHGSVMPYKRYLDATHAARDQYLATTYHAHRQYLTGPWPDRATYQTVENTAWNVYYQAAREAWQRYTAELDTADPLPQRIPGHTAAEDAGYGLDPFDERQETYLAADPNRRDNP